ncbi:Spo0E like sporulation regulatory protein [Fontibacillus panacisegetis]|uniref:Spo0E like sporulation regulatory protein n=1 Tax=Fontibacillus panacisegetis TaxID=670482 RepID=A0A1G7U8X2_9BACL|nr:aspartyl-phosphate phosphatase Spo0E family protein [Fontibacillus panacisegetis]SDG43913.1 Spo0E like sporulation regulatory protein [Fontibacillus panacisegetis]
MMAYPAFGNLSRTSSRPKISSELLVTIEDLRTEMMNAADDENFSSDTVLELSQRLDNYIVQAQIQMLGR